MRKLFAVMLAVALLAVGGSFLTSPSYGPDQIVADGGSGGGDG